ncbi:MAG: ATP-dependent helicase [Thermodesulfobacteriota bacterium]|nr:ATP-dependent helicase [Thermodesulfobacteriota bacterium]
MKINYHNQLNEEQLCVVLADGGPMLVIAGAGSGKTRTLTYRVAHLIERGLEQENLLLLTFTNKAAREMLDRVENLVGADVKGIWGGTFHHVANIILRRHAPLIGYSNNFTILDRGDSKEIITMCLKEKELRKSDFPQADILLDIISYAVNTKTSIKETILLKYPHLYRVIDKIIEMDDVYQKRKKELNGMDFDDLLCNLEVLLTHDETVRNYYSMRFKHVLVDEYQDTNILQAGIVDIFGSCHRNLMVVGDDAQSIYSFRGANFTNIFTFQERYPDAMIYKLRTNYRSTPEILRLANHCITNNRQQFKKELKPVRKKGVKPYFIPQGNVYTQAGYVSEKIQQFMRNGCPKREIAVLYRSHYHSMEVQVELTRKNIPFEVRSGIRFFEQAHIKDVLSYLRIALNARDETAWKRVFRLHPHIGPVTVEKLWNIILPSPVERFCSISEEKTITKRVRENLTPCVNLMGELRRKDFSTQPSEVIGLVMEMGYTDYIKNKYPNYESRIEDIQQLKFYSALYPTLDRFLSDMSLLGNFTEDEIQWRESKDAEDRVTLTTVHQAKGLEWSKVFIIWLAEGYFPSAKSLKEEEGEEEERRLFYVAVTRAKDDLHLCYPVFSRDYGYGIRSLSPSRFLKEVPRVSYDQIPIKDMWNE